MDCKSMQKVLKNNTFREEKTHLSPKTAGKSTNSNLRTILFLFFFLKIKVEND